MLRGMWLPLATTRITVAFRLVLQVTNARVRRPGNEAIVQELLKMNINVWYSNCDPNY